MRRPLKAFTLLEVLICLAITGIAFFPFMTMTDRLYVAYHKSMERASQQAELERICYKVQSLLRTHPNYSISADNRGAAWPGGGVQWSGEHLTANFKEKMVTLSDNVTLFSLHRRAGVTYLTLARTDERSGNEHRLMIRVEKL